ncbi:MAG TPA: hypothetical protein P5096_02125 [Patescibacteria group bacterium]|nr:hypothetical protein [Patescibacteria group bacterium]
MRLKVNGVFFGVEQNEISTSLVLSFKEYMKTIEANKIKMVINDLMDKGKNEGIYLSSHTTDALNTMHPRNNETAFIMRFKKISERKLLSFVKSCNLDCEIM